MKMFNKIAIVGVGLIGGSIGLACRKKKLARDIVGVCRREVSRRKALKFRAVGKATLNLKEGLKDADLVIIAAPVGKIVKLALASYKYMKAGTILTDVGSSKRDIASRIEKPIGRRVHYIGAHPMAGSDRSGVENADPGIFNKAVVIITKTKNSHKKSLTTLVKFWRSLGSRVIVLSPEEHDSRVSLASYLPHAVSFALSASQTRSSLKLAAGSLKDTTRVASSDTELWNEIFLSTRAQTLKAINLFLERLKALEKALRKKDKKALKKFLDGAKKLRGQIEE